MASATRTASLKWSSLHPIDLDRRRLGLEHMQIQKYGVFGDERMAALHLWWPLVWFGWHRHAPKVSQVNKPS